MSATSEMEGRSSILKADSSHRSKSLQRMKVTIERRSAKKRTGEYEKDGWKIIDVTSKSTTVYQQFSPFYPHGGIPVPGMEGCFSESVEGLWQGLKVFENEGTDETKFHNVTMKNLKRPTRTRGKVLGHEYEGKLLGYVEARKKIYIPSYCWVLENKLQLLVQQLREELLQNNIVLLDYEVNSDVNDTSSPLSHASIVKGYLEETLLP